MCRKTGEKSKHSHAAQASGRLLASSPQMPVLDKCPLQETVDCLNDLHAYIVAPRGHPALTG